MNDDREFEKAICATLGLTMAKARKYELIHDDTSVSGVLIADFRAMWDAGRAYERGLVLTSNNVAEELAARNAELALQAAEHEEAP